MGCTLPTGTKNCVIHVPKQRHPSRPSVKNQILSNTKLSARNLQMKEDGESWKVRMIRVGVLSMVCCLFACAEVGVDEWTDEPAHTNTALAGKSDGYGDQAPRCVITMCLTGAMNQNTPSNEAFRELCSDFRQIAAS